jgi:RimJ/RimL family protein N-acetyltransferase
MILRDASRGDLDRVRGVLVEWWGGRDLSALLQPLFLENFASTSLIAEDDDGGLAGFLVGFPSVDDPASAYVHFVAVAPPLRGTGLGRGLHDEFAQRMSARGASSIRCVTSPVNTASIAFHERIGFHVESRDEEYVHFVRRLESPRSSPRVDPRPDDGPWATAQWPVDPSTVLTTAGVSLRLARPEDAPALFAALDHDACWTHVRGRPESADDFASSIIESTRVGRWMWIVERDGAVVGTTSFLEVSPVDARLEIGFTVYAPGVWGTDVNPACKFLLMSWAFDHGFGRVQLKTDIRNARSQQAISRLGATCEGVLRRYQRRQDGSVRDTVVFSVAAEEWPDVRAGLLARLPTEPPDAGE